MSRSTSSLKGLLVGLGCIVSVTHGYTTDNGLYFANRKYMDFRSMAQYATGVPALITDPARAAAAPMTSDWFNGDWGFWNQNWETAASAQAPIRMVNSRNNVYFEKNTDGSTFLTLRTARHSTFQSAAEAESVDSDYQFMSMKAYSRVTGSTGACSGMFTYRGNPDARLVQEADLELLTYEAERTAHYTNQPSLDAAGNVETRATRTVTMPVTRQTWAEHRMDWTADRVRWSVDGAAVADLTFQVPRDPASVIFNLWGNGGEWTRAMPVGGVAFYQIQWVEILYNTTADN